MDKLNMILKTSKLNSFFFSFYWGFFSAGFFTYKKTKYVIC